jgi:stage II sporulation protein D
VKLFLLCLAVCQLGISQVVYKVQRLRDGHSEYLTLKSEEYAEAVLAGESSTFRSDAALQAMAIAARTYAARMKGRHKAEGFDFCATTHCQRLELGEKGNRLRDAVRATQGLLLWFEGTPAFTVYSRDCGGISEDASVVWPDIHARYLRIHEDQYCLRHGSSRWQWAANPGDIADALRSSGLKCPEPLSGVTIASRTGSRRAKLLTLENPTERSQISASSFRFALGRNLGWNGLRSERYEVVSDGQKLRFGGVGQGHGVGLCQKGADEMGVEGKTFRDILAYYYPGTEVGATARGLVWRTLKGNGVTILTTHPDLDRTFVALAESVRVSIMSATHLPLPETITVRVYPSVEVFRNGTGEPGWVAARTSGGNIETQPLQTLRARGVLRSTLYHEFLHVAVETGAHPSLPLWFREGLAECLSRNEDRQNHPARAGPSSDDALQQRSDERSARQGHDDARRRVESLFARYSKGEVLGWLRTGIPPEVSRSMDNKENTNSR